LAVDTLKVINERYSALAKTSCCLSCGGALSFADVQPGEVCVDLGSGRGRDVVRLAEATGPQGFAYGIDTADGMLDKARSTAAALGVTNVEFRRSTLEQVDLPNGIANVVISNCTINHASDKDAAWSEMFRVLKPGGRFVVSDVYALADVPERYHNDPQAVAECWAGAVRKDVYLDTLRRTGFQEVRLLEESEPYAKGAIEVASFTLTGRKPASDAARLQPPPSDKEIPV
jgi:arsenite methyltransferase